MPSIEYLDWPAPARVKACYTLRTGGNSAAPYQSFNVGDHVGDSPSVVLANRQLLAQAIGQTDIVWLNQVHGINVLEASTLAQAQEADACFSHTADQVCCIMTADCLPVFFCDQSGSQVAIAHAGWRGLLNGVLQNTLETFVPADQVIAYLGPAISQRVFEVGEEVRAAFVQQYSGMSAYFLPSAVAGKWLADLSGIARDLLLCNGVNAVYGGTRCTYTEAEHFFSYRRDGVTGRMANLIWLSD